MGSWNVWNCVGKSSHRWNQHQRLISAVCTQFVTYPYSDAHCWGGHRTGLPEEHDATVHHGQMANYHAMHRAMFCRDDVGLVIHADDADDTEDVKTEIPEPEYLKSGMFQKLVTIRRFPRSYFLLNTGTFYFPTPDASVGMWVHHRNLLMFPGLPENVLFISTSFFYELKRRLLPEAAPRLLVIYSN